MTVMCITINRKKLFSRLKGWVLLTKKILLNTISYIIVFNNIFFCMPKLKTRKSAAKRYKMTGTGNFLRRHAFKGHLLMKKSNRQKRKLSQTICVSLNDIKPIRLMLPY